MLGSKILIPILALVLSAPTLAADKPAAATKPAGPARVVCFGDSITKQGYGDLVAKQLNVTVANAGVGGQNTAQGLKRIKADVLDRKPAVVVVLFGTNDSRLGEGANVPVEQYEKNLASIVDQCAAAGAKVVICTLPPIEEKAYFTRHKKEPFDAAGGFDKVIASYRAAAVRAAEAKKCPLVDLNQLLGKEDRGVWLSPDGVHPTEKGKQMIADHVAKAVKPLLEGK